LEVTADAYRRRDQADDDDDQHQGIEDPGRQETHVSPPWKTKIPCLNPCSGRGIVVPPGFAAPYIAGAASFVRVNGRERLVLPGNPVRPATSGVDFSHTAAASHRPATLWIAFLAY
jgi:hypothetical protein